MVTFERRITFHVNRMTHDAQIHYKFVVGLFMYWARFLAVLWSNDFGVGELGQT